MFFTEWNNVRYLILSTFFYYVFCGTVFCNVRYFYTYAKFYFSYLVKVIFLPYFYYVQFYFPFHQTIYFINTVIVGLLYLKKAYKQLYARKNNLRTLFYNELSKSLVKILFVGLSFKFSNTGYSSNKYDSLWRIIRSRFNFWLHHVSSGILTLLSILADINNDVVCMVTILPLISIFSGVFLTKP